MDGHTLQAQSPDYPRQLTALLGPDAPPAIACAGATDLLRSRMLALLCSRQCPGAMIMQTYEFVQRLRHRALTIVGGFHAPMEKECLRALMAGTAGVIWCLAKSLESFAMPAEFEPLMDSGRLLVLSPYAPAVTRITADTSARRNVVAAAIADEIFLPYAAPGSSTESFCLSLLAWEKPVLTLAAEDNQGILDRGAQAIGLRDVDTLWPAKPAATVEDELV